MIPPQQSVYIDAIAAVQDYVVTRYVGEFFNTVTSFIYIVYGIHGILRYKRQHVGLLSTPNLSYWALIGVGIFSGLYHSTLKYHTQMSDEMSMHLAIGTVLHQVFTFQEPPHVQRRNTVMIVGVLVPFIIYHCIADEFIVHMALFAAMCWLVASRTRHLIATRIHDRRRQDRIRKLLSFATYSAMMGYAIWNADVHFCSAVTGIKQKVGMPISILLELHGWWHALTAISAYTFMAIIEFLLTPDHVEGQGKGFAWPATAVLLDIAPEPSTGVQKKGFEDSIGHAKSN